MHVSKVWRTTVFSTVSSLWPTNCTKFPTKLTAASRAEVWIWKPQQQRLMRAMLWFSLLHYKVKSSWNWTRGVSAQWLDLYKRTCSFHKRTKTLLLSTSLIADLKRFILVIYTRVIGASIQAFHAFLRIIL